MAVVRTNVPTYRRRKSVKLISHKAYAAINRVCSTRRRNSRAKTGAMLRFTDRLKPRRIGRYTSASTSGSTNRPKR